jgi:STE24 endopeptidase
MTSYLFSELFVGALLLTTVIKLWLARRHLLHITAHRDEVPPAFASEISLEAHQKAADYTSAKTRVAMVSTLFDAAILLILTLGGAIGWLMGLSQHWFDAPILQGIFLIVAVVLAGGILDIPFDLYRTFVVEERFGFNKMTLGLYIIDALKSILLGAILGLPLLFGVLWVMEKMGANWWLYVWGIWVAFSLLILFIYPTFIAPLFNKFLPMEDGALKASIEALLAKCGFHASGLFVMDGSKRSSHGNAYFTGFGKTKRIVFFDTLITRLSTPEIEAVLAHELGHFKYHHVIKRIAASFATTLGFFWLLAQLMQAGWFYEGLGVAAPASSLSTALALLLLFLVLPVFSFLLHPLTSAYSRKHEFEADAYAAKQTHARDLISALVKMYHDNAATLTPDPVYSLFYDSHPPAAMRIGKLQTL